MAENGDLFGHLEKAGLDPQRWVDILRSELGVTSVQSFKYLNQRSLKKLKPYFKYDWEESAFEDIIGLKSSDGGNYHNKQFEAKKQKLQEAEKIMTELENLQREKKRKNDELLAKKADKVRSLLDIPDDKWIYKDDTRSFDKIIADLNKCVVESGKGLSTLDKMNPRAVVENASGGLLLCGTLLTKNVEDTIQRRKQLIEVPDGVEIKGPVMPTNTKIIEIDSKTKADNFERAVENSGYSIAANLSVGILSWGLGVRGGFSKTHNEESEHEKSSSKSEIFHSRVISALVPTGSVELQSEELRLSDGPLKELTSIEQLQKTFPGNDKVQTACEQFFSKYGSHVNIGLTHVGGIYKWTATFCSQSNSSKEKIKTMVQDAGDAFVSIGFIGTAVIGGAHVSGDYLKQSGNFKGSYNQSDLSKTELHCQTWGGPPDASSLPQWKTGLICDSSTWVVIDRGEMQYDNFLGVWDLVRNQTESFANASELADVLLRTWERMTGLSIEDLKGLSLLVADFKSKVEDVIRRCEKEKAELRYRDALRLLLEQKQNCETKLRTSQPWMNLLKENKALSAFLVNVTLEKHEEKDISFIKLYIKQLMEHVDIGVFPATTQILLWVDADRTTQNPTSIWNEKEFSSVNDFLVSIRNDLLPNAEIEEARCASLDTLHRRITEDVTVAVNRLLENIMAINASEYTFLTSVLLKFDYSIEHSRYEVLLTTAKLREFLEECARDFRDFLQHKERGKGQMQSYLVHLVIDCIDDTIDQTGKEALFSRMIDPMRQLLIDPINVLVKSMTEQSPFRFTELSVALKSMMQGDFNFNSEVSITCFEELRRGEIPEVDNGTKNNSEDVYEFQENDIMTLLGLTDYYPSKITVQKVISLTSEDNTHLQPKDLPWRVLKKIMASDLRWRDKDIPEAQLKMQEATRRETESDSTPFGDISSFLDADEASPESHTIDVLHPLDVFVPTFLCCADDLRQIIIQKLFKCKQAIPMVCPTPGKNLPFFSLLPLRSLFMDCRTANMSASVLCAATHTAKTVAFIRVKSVGLSKSKLINEILSDQSQSTFCYRDLLPEETKPSTVEGLIEATWYLPSGKATDAFKEVITFLNLRGNASLLSKETTVLAKLASTIIVLVDVSVLANAETRAVMDQLCETSSEVVLLLTAQPDSIDISRLRENLKQLNQEKKKIKMLQTFSLTSKSPKTAATLKKELRQAISSLIETQDVVSLAHCGHGLTNKKFAFLDEKRNDCMDGCTFARKVYAKLCPAQKVEADDGILNTLPLVKSKRESLPLQGSLWQEWSNLNKSQRKSKKINEVSSIQLKMDEIRKKQIQICNELSPAVLELIKCLLNNIGKDKSCPSLVMWLKMFLNENSRNILPNLIRTFHNAWTDVREAKDNPEAHTNVNKLLEIANTAEHELAEASFGFEHFVRELGQIYESVMESHDLIEKETKETVSRLPSIAAGLLTKGQAIEIMDGDAANVPLEWIKAILKSLKEIIGDKKLFVVSVLGIQSSGKSTLLNTMFGLQFAVSAGRCTRGVFARLVPVEDTNLPCDYFLVVDTEGLRAPELGQIHLDHDNELATFVIGIGDVTLINIKGENTAEVKDVLQIAVHAFLRMALANKRIEMHRKCFFVHQNVGAINAAEQMMQGLKQLQDALDEMTKNAAEEENILDISRFSQVIDFQGEKHVLYFPDLWSGDPPMAPCNVGYSEKAQEIKSRLKDMTLEKKSFVTVSDLAFRIEDLWNGIITDNFVFSFRNSLEIKAYNFMDTKYHELTRQYEEAITTWFEKTACIEIELCHDSNNLESCFSQLYKQLLQEMAPLQMKIRTDLEDYFDNTEMQDIVIQWRQNRLNRFEEMTKSLMLGTKLEMRNKTDERRVALLSENQDRMHEDDINKKARSLAEQLRGKHPSKKILNKRFDEMWTKWTVALVGTVPRDKESVASKVQTILIERFQQHQKLLWQYLDPQKPLTPLRNLHRLLGSWSVYDVDASCLSIKEKGAWDKLKAKYKEWKDGDSFRLHVNKQAALRIDSVFRKADHYLHTLLSKDAKFLDQHARGLVHLVVEAVAEENKQEEDFKFLPSYLVRISVHVCRYAIAKFEEMKTRYEERHGQQAKLDAYKKTAKHLFMNTFRNEAVEVVAADFFCDRIQEKIEEAVRRSLPRRISDKVRGHFTHKKYHLMLSIMEHLANKLSFSSFMSYIHDSYAYTSEWIQDYINKEIFTKLAGRTTAYMELVSELLNPIVSRIILSIEHATTYAKTQTGNKIKCWVTQFGNHVKTELAVPPEILTDITNKDIADITHFQTLLLAKVGDLKSNIIDVFQQHEPKSIVWDVVSPHEKVMEQLWGCREHCPFCKEPCSQNKDHANEMSHTCIQHRPQGIKGTSWKENQKLCVEACSYNVQCRGITFSCGACSNKCRNSGKCQATGDNVVYHNYSDYKTYLPDWDIEPSPNMDSSKFWMWFMHTYKNDLAKHYGKELLDIPSSWKSITKEDALKSLREAKEKIDEKK